MKNIQKQVEGLLDAQDEYSGKHQSFRYEASRKIVQHPEDPSQYVVKVDEKSKKAANPIPYEEILLTMEEVKQSGIDLIKEKQLKPEEETKQIQMLERAFAKEVDRINSRQVEADKTPANLFADKASPANKLYQKSLQALSQHLKHFIDITARISKSSVKKLDAQGHKRRSRGRPTIVQEFKVGRDQREDSKHFVMYIPAGRYTQRQMALRQLQGEEGASHAHSTSSHHKEGLVHGNSNFARMIVGKKDSDGNVTILHDSFTGPGARLPYKTLDDADKYKAMAVKSITFMNQEEIIQAMAQRVYDQKLAGKTNLEIIDLLSERPEQGDLNEHDFKNALIKQYFAENPLTETYTQVISPGQGRVPLADGSDANVAQFEYVRDAIRAFDGAKDLELNIEKDDGYTLDIAGKYKGRHGAFGVNWFKSTSDGVAANANRRFMNQIIDDTLADLPDSHDLIDIATVSDETHPDAHAALTEIKEKYYALKTTLDKFKQLEHETHVLQLQIDGISDEKVDYRNKLMDYSKFYQTLVNLKKNGAGKEAIKTAKKTVDTDYKEIKALENTIHKKEKEIDHQHESLERLRASTFQKSGIKDEVEALRKSIASYKTGLFEKPEGIDEKELTDTFNKTAYLSDTLDLYYNKTWADDKHNFKMQALIGSLATALGHANTKGCKSNNDRGQRLAQKIAGNLLYTEQSHAGLYDGSYFDPPAMARMTKRKTTAATAELQPLLQRDDILGWEIAEDKLRDDINTELLTIQTLHHTANTGVGGGKFSIRNKYGFADNGLLGKVASLAKLKDVGKSKVFNKKNKLEVAVGIITGGLYYLGKFLFQKAAKALGKGKIKKEVATLTKEAKSTVEYEPPTSGNPITTSDADMLRGLHAVEHTSAHRDEMLDDEAALGESSTAKKSAIPSTKPSPSSHDEAASKVAQTSETDDNEVPPPHLG